MHMELQVSNGREEEISLFLTPDASAVCFCLFVFVFSYLFITFFATFLQLLWETRVNAKQNQCYVTISASCVQNVLFEFISGVGRHKQTSY